MFFCYSRPAFDKEESTRSGEDIWNAESGDVKWYLYDVELQKIVEEASQIIDIIRSTPETKRRVDLEQKTLSVYLLTPLFLGFEDQRGAVIACG